MKKQILTIFGGSGFVGKSFLDSFIKNKLAFFNIGKLNLVSRSAKEKLSFVKNSDVSLYNFNFETKIGELPETTDFIINGVDLANYDSYIDGYNNKSLIDNVLDISISRYNSAKHVYLSSGAVYGFQKELKGFKESFENPDFSNFSLQKKIYAESKLNFEKAYKLFSNENRKVIVARCFSFIGSNVPLDQHFAIGNFYSSVFNKKKIQIKSKLNIYRSYMDAEDLVFWIMTMMTQNKLNYDIFNVGSDNKIEIEEISKLFKDIFGIETERVNGKSEENDIYIPNIEKAKNTYNLDYKRDLKYLIKYNFDQMKK